MAGMNFPLLSPKETSIDEEENYPSLGMEKSPQRTLKNLFTTLFVSSKMQISLSLQNEIGTRYISEYIHSRKVLSDGVWGTGTLVASTLSLDILENWVMHIFVPSSVLCSPQLSVRDENITKIFQNGQKFFWRK